MGREAEDGSQSGCVFPVEWDQPVYELEWGHGGRLLGHLQRHQREGDEARNDGAEEGVRDVCDNQHCVRAICAGRSAGEGRKAGKKVKSFAGFHIGKLLKICDRSVVLCSPPLAEKRYIMTSVQYSTHRASSFPIDK